MSNAGIGNEMVDYSVMHHAWNWLPMPRFVIGSELPIYVLCKIHMLKPQSI